MAETYTDGKGNYITWNGNDWVPTSAPTSQSPGQGAFGGNATIDPVSGAEIPPESSSSLPRASERIVQAAREGYEASTPDVTPGRLMSPVNYGLAQIPGVLGGALRGAQQLAVETLPRGLGRDVAALPEAFPFGGPNRLFTVPERPPPFRPSPRFVPEYYGEGTPQNPLGSQTLLQQVTGAIQRADQDQGPAPPGGARPPPAEPPPSFVPPGTSAYPPGTPRAVDAGPRRGDVLGYGTPTEGGAATSAPPAAQPAPSPRPGYRENVDPTKPFTYNPPSSGWPAGTSTWAENQPPRSLPAAPTTAAEAKQIASSYYERANQPGNDATLTPQFFDKIYGSARDAGKQTEAGQATAGPNAITALLDRWQALKGKPLPLASAQEMYEGLGDLIDQEWSGGRLSKVGTKLADVQKDLRNQIDNPASGDTAGNASALAAFAPARQAWSQAMKMDDLERIQYRASLTDNPATSIKTQIRGLLTNPRNSYSEVERAALEAAATRGTLGSALHVFGGRLVPLVAGAAGATHGPVGAVISAGATHIGSGYLRDWASQIQQNRLGGAISTMGQGVPPPP